MATNVTTNTNLTISGNLTVNGTTITIGNSATTPSITIGNTSSGTTTVNGNINIGTNAAANNTVTIGNANNGNVVINGNATATTQASSDNSTKIATTAFVNNNRMNFIRHIDYSPNSTYLNVCIPTGITSGSNSSGYIATSGGFQFDPTHEVFKLNTNKLVLMNSSMFIGSANCLIQFIYKVFPDNAANDNSPLFTRILKKFINPSLTHTTFSDAFIISSSIFSNYSANYSNQTIKYKVRLNINIDSAYITNSQNIQMDSNDSVTLTIIEA